MDDEVIDRTERTATLTQLGPDSWTVTLFRPDGPNGPDKGASITVSGFEDTEATARKAMANWLADKPAELPPRTPAMERDLDHLRQTLPDAIIDMDAVVADLHAMGHPAFVQQTGGGCATIQAGTPFTDSLGDDRYPVLAGPGWFEGPGFTVARANVADFYIGPDEDDPDLEDVVIVHSPDTMAIALTMAAFLTPKEA